MSRKRRVSTDGSPPLSNNPFAALQSTLGDLPSAGPVDEPMEPQPDPADAPPPALRGKIVVRREKKGRGGKTATVVEGLELPAEALAKMAQQLRRSFGCGAHVEGAKLVVTGAQTDRVREWVCGQGATRVVIGN